jgi:hypothetical protein
VFTEGPVKALALLQAGALPVDLGGVWNGTVKPKNDQEPTELVPPLRAFNWAGRTVHLAFDGDYETNPSVRQALFRTALQAGLSSVLFCDNEQESLCS